MERDEETGMQTHGVRRYAVWLARWTSSDPSGTRAGLNRYAYVGGNPINNVDPSGFSDVPVLIPLEALTACGTTDDNRNPVPSDGTLKVDDLVAARQQFDAKEAQLLTPSQLQAVHEAVEAETSDNLALQTSFYQYYATYGLAAGAHGTLKDEDGNPAYGLTNPESGGTTIDAGLLLSEDEMVDTLRSPTTSLDAAQRQAHEHTLLLGGVLFHEFGHVDDQNSGGIEAARAAFEGRSYAIELYLSAKAGNKPRMVEIAGIKSSNLYRNSTEFQLNFLAGYQFLQDLDKIAHNTPDAPAALKATLAQHGVTTPDAVQGVMAAFIAENQDKQWDATLADAYAPYEQGTLHDLHSIGF